jgi:hypothetical protein
MFSATSFFRDELTAIRLLPILLPVVANLTACINIKTPVHRLGVPVPYRMPAQLPPGAERLPIKAGVYYSPEFSNYEHFDRTYGESGIATPVGEFSVRQFNSMLSAMFTGVMPVNQRPPYAPNSPGSDAQIIIEPRIERFDLDIATFAIGPLTARVEYRFKLYLPDGTTLATWKISASDTGEKGWTTHGVDFNGARTKALVRKSSIEFMQKFFDAPEVKTWLAELETGKTVTPQMAKTPDAAFDTNASAVASGATAVVANMTLDGVDISGQLYWQAGLNQIPIQHSSIKSPVLATRLTIKNNRSQPIVFDPSTLRLSTNRFSVLKPDSPRAVAERFLRGSGSGGSGSAAEIFFGPAGGAIFGAFAEMDQANRKDLIIRKLTDELSRVQLDDQIIAPNTTVSGMAYFIALGIDARLDEPELRVSIADPSQRKTYETALNMKAGTGTAETLVLAGIKPPGSVAEKAPRTKAPLQDKEVFGPAKEVERIALLPADGWYLTQGSSDAITEGKIQELARKTLAESGQVIVDRSDLESYYRGSIWAGTGSKKQLDLTYAVAEGKKLQVDGVLTFKYLKRLNYEPHIIEIDVTLIDVATSRVYRASGKIDSIKNDTETVLRSFMRSKGHRTVQRAGVATATGATLVAAGSGQPESTTIRTERTAVQQQAEEVTGTTTKPLQVGILPPASIRGGSSVGAQTEREIHDQILRFIQSTPTLALGHDYTARDGAGSSDVYAVWQGSYVKKVPDKTKLRVIAEELGADILVLASVKSGTSYSPWRDVSLYVFDVASGKMYQGSDDLTRIKGLIASTFGPIESQQSRQHDRTTMVTGSTLHPAESTLPESTTGTIENTAASMTEQSTALPQLLNPTELRLLLTGNTITGETSKGTRYHVYYRADGIAYGETLSGKYKGDRDDGIWGVSDERGHCLEWTQWLGGEKRCYNVFRNGNRVIFEQNSGHEGGKSSGVMRPGNPENL